MTLWAAAPAEPRPIWDVDWDIEVPQPIDDLLLKALNVVIPSPLLRCYLVDLSEEDLEGIVAEIEGNVDLEDRAAFHEWVADMPVNAGQKFLAMAANIQWWSARLPQGIGMKAKYIRKLTPKDATARLIRRKIYEKSVEMVGKNGSKYFGRLGSKVLPIVGQVSVGYEVIKACNCYRVT